jgi:hypothetical protein
MLEVVISDAARRASTFSTLLLEELAEQAFSGLLVAPALDENIEHEAVLVDGTPEPMLLPGEADDHLIEVPFVATARRSPTDPVGEFCDGSGCLDSFRGE